MANRLKLSLCAACLAMIGLVAWAAEPPKTDAVIVKKGENLVEVTVSGEGLDKDSATLDAKRKAVEQGAGTFIYSHSETKDFQLEKDTILARAAGYIQETTEVSSKQLVDDTWTVKVKCLVSIKGIEDTWGVVQNLLKDKGRPKIMVYVKEEADGKLADDSTVQARIENLLLKSGFLLVDKKQIKEIDKKDLAAAVGEDKPDKAIAIAKRFGAQVFITGSCDASTGERSTVSGVTIFKFGAVAKIRCFNADNAELLASENENGMSADRMRNVAMDKSLTAVGNKIAPIVQEDILRKWLDAMTGGGSITLEVDGITLKQATALTEELKKIKELKDVPDPDFANKVATWNLSCTVSAKQLAKAMLKVDNLDITDTTQNVIKATYQKSEK